MKYHSLHALRLVKNILIYGTAFVIISSARKLLLNRPVSSIVGISRGWSAARKPHECTMCKFSAFKVYNEFSELEWNRENFIKPKRSYRGMTRLSLSASSSDNDSGATAQDIPSSMEIFSSGVNEQYIVMRTPVSKSSELQEPRIIHQVALKHRESDGSGSNIGGGITSSVFHATNGPVPRGTLSSIILLSGVDDDSMRGEVVQAMVELVEGSIRWYLDSGGRISRLSVAVSSYASKLLQKLGEMGFKASPLFTDEFSSLHGAVVPPKHEIVSCESQVLLAYLSEKAKQHSNKKGDERYKAHLNNLLGRLLHDLGRPDESVAYFTQSLQQDSSSASTFRNLGSAYQATGNAQMAFASYQQAVQLDPGDALVYLKLAFFYEDFAKMDWDDAGDHAERCYRYYLESVDPDDTSVMTRLGNLLVRQHQAAAAVEVYERVLSLDPSLHNVWFNKAHAHIKKGEISKAIDSLQRTLALEPNIVAASHMLKALSEDEAQGVNKADERYVRDLFNDYGADYDNHVKKLLYSAPRVVRQELSKIYKGRFNIPEDELGGVPAGVDDGGCTVVIPTIKINNTLDILDLGCGTGLAGAWLKDYAKTLTGVDLSDGMVEVARKKMIYQQLHVTSIDEFLDSCTNDFDLVVAVDVLSYIGDLENLFKKVEKVLRPDAYFAFTVEAISKGRGASVGEDSGDRIEKGTTEQSVSMQESIIDDEVESLVAANKHRGFSLLRSGRFGHAKAYIDRMLQEMGPDVEVALSRQFSPRLDTGNPVPGYLFVVHRKQLVQR